MCGICGVFSYGPGAPPVDAGELQAVRDSMTRRGPDGAGLWISPSRTIGLGHRRLSIIDLSDAGLQPMSTADRRFWISFNGEIYNFRALRSELGARGHVFRSTSDTEVLLALYREHGSSMVSKLRGMFAFAIWDDLERRLLLARDPFGIKPLYYSDDGRTLRFASQVKAILAGGAIADTPDPAGHAGFFLWGSVPEPLTTFRSIRSLPAGAIMEVGPGRVEAPRRYFSIASELAGAEEAAARAAPEDTKALLRDALRDTVRHHMIADVPVGVFLSAGIDSSVIAATAAELAAGPLRAVTLGFAEYSGTPDDETSWASNLASELRIDHRISLVTESDFRAQIPVILADMDQPSIDGVNTHLVSRAAAAFGLKVVLSGIGGDELFGGYPSFRDVPRLARLPALGQRLPRLARVLRSALLPLSATGISPKYPGLFEHAGSVNGAYYLRRGLFMPWELPKLMDRDMARAGLLGLAEIDGADEDLSSIRDPYLQVMALEVRRYLRNQLLRDTDWAGMAHSIEVRTPFVDVEFFRRLCPALVRARRPSKQDLATACAHPLPKSHLMRAKTGFGVPIDRWLDTGATSRMRGMRSWARRVNTAPGVGRRVLVVTSDAFGRNGGIALFNRQFLTALCLDSRVREVVCIPRHPPQDRTDLPAKLSQALPGGVGALSYLRTVASVAMGGGIDLIVCGHINLAPLALLLRYTTRAPAILCIYGIDAWQRPRRFLTRVAARRIRPVVYISQVTHDRFLAWSKQSADSGFYLPNAIEAEEFGAGPKCADLEDRYGLRGRTVLLTLGRLVAKERYKGFDEIMEAMPLMLARHPDIVYVIAGDGSDRQRLETKARSLGLEDRVRFTGYVDPAEKAALYRTADAYVMPSRGEGFGYVFLEAMACGIPVVGSKVDGGREALLDGKLGALVDPDDPHDIARGVDEALQRGRGVPAGLEYYDFSSFVARSRTLLDRVID